MNRSTSPPIYFDITTAAHWQGRAVGIVRVERELGKRAEAIVGDRLRFCVYARNENAFYEIPRDLAQYVLAGLLSIRFEASPTATASVAPAAPQSLSGRLRRRARAGIMAIPGAYEAVQGLRGRPISPYPFLTAIPKTLPAAQERSPEDDPSDRPDFQSKVTWLHSVASRPIDFAPGSIVVSGGLDWEYKDLRALNKLKAKHGFRYATIIYDLIPLITPHYVVPAYVDLLTDFFGELFWLADAGLAISHTSELDARRYCNVNRIDRVALDSFPLGSDLPTKSAGRADLPKKLAGAQFALFVSTIEPRKNHRVLYEAWHIALSKGLVDPTRHRLVFVGQVGWNSSDLVYEIEANPLTRDSIVRVSDVSDDVLDSLYRCADFCLMPSHYEGYGLPLAEALRHGKPCLSSTAAALQEVGGDFVDYLDPWNPQDWAQAIGEMFNDPERRTAKSARISAGFKTVNWDQSAQVFFDTLARLLP